jgi:hypothetical protein
VTNGGLLATIDRQQLLIVATKSDSLPHLFILNPKPVVSVLQQMRRHEEAIPAFETSAELDKSSGSALVRSLLHCHGICCT